MTLADCQPYLTAISALLGVATLGFIINLVKIVHDNAQDRLAIQDERLKLAAEDQQRIEKWAERDKSDLRNQLNKTKADLDALLKKEGLDLDAIAWGKQLSASTTEVRATAEALIGAFKTQLARLTLMDHRKEDGADPGWELSAAMGAMAVGSFNEAATHFDAYARDGGMSWRAQFSRGVAYANRRAGIDSDLASLRAYNDAIALAPVDLEGNYRARLFCYRGAMLKRLGRLDESEADLNIAIGCANATDEILDINYNLSCIYAMRGEREAMLQKITLFKASKKYRQAVQAHLDDYFSKFSNDRDLLSAINPAV